MGILRIDLVSVTISSLPSWSSFPAVAGADWYRTIAQAGFGGMQGGDPAMCRAAGLDASASGRVDKPGDAYECASRWRDAGYSRATLHAGTGLEDDDDAVRLAESILDATRRTGFPLYLETHRATITQDMWRTVHLIKRLPDLRFNADLSHWYTGQEMRYGGKPITPILDFIQPVLDRVGFFHGRLGNGGSIQVAIDPERDAGSAHLLHWQEILTRAFRAVRTCTPPDQVVPFAIELLPAANFYARTFPGPDGALREESDRWQQALVIKELAERWWAATAP